MKRRVLQLGFKLLPDNYFQYKKFTFPILTRCWTPDYKSFAIQQTIFTNQFGWIAFLLPVQFHTSSFKVLQVCSIMANGVSSNPWRRCSSSKYTKDPGRCCICQTGKRICHLGDHQVGRWFRVRMMRNDVHVLLLVIFDCSVEITKPEERACFNNGLAPLTGVASVLDCCPSSDSIAVGLFLSTTVTF